ncbi:MAG TPA: heme-binding protein [Negativicutes bacterium]|jgi:uncharacterized protein GlcG (DUF336 family)
MKMTLDLAKRLVELALERAKQDFEMPITVAICDDNGFLVTFARQEGCPLRGIQLSQSKAHTAVRMGVSTDVLFNRLKKDQLDIRWFCDPLMTPLPGGSLLKDQDGKLLGAAGVSGMAAHEDNVITEYLAELVSSGQVR